MGITRFGWLVALILLIGHMGCQSHDNDAAAYRGPVGELWLEDDDGHYQPVIVDMSDVMQAKLVHMQAIVEGLARSDLRQVAVNAEAMRELSEQSTWIVHDTITYVALSDEFRGLMERMSRHARANDMNAAIEDYTAVTRSCVACHDYLRRERLHKDLPGAVSMLSELQ